MLSLPINSKTIVASHDLTLFFMFYCRRPIELIRMRLFIKSTTRKKSSRSKIYENREEKHITGHVIGIGVNKV